MGSHPIPLLYLQGSHREIGRQFGETCRAEICHSIANARKLVEDTAPQIHLTWEGAIIQARKYIPFVEERFPQYVEELQGMAEGSGAQYDEIAAVNAMEAVTMDALHLTIL